MDRQVKALLDRKGDNVHTIEANATVFRAIELMDRMNVGALVVVDGSQVVGIVSERDYTRKVILKNRSSKETAVREIMTAEVMVARMDTTLEEAMQLMTRARVRHLPVMVGDRLGGILSIGDLVKAMLREQRDEIDWLKEYAFGPHH